MNDLYELIDIESITVSDDVSEMIDIEVEEDHSFILSNGIISHNSATGGLLKVRDIKKHGFFPLRGLPMNTYGESDARILDNKELNNIMSILDVKFPEYYQITLDNGEEIIASNNDEIYIDGKWITVKSLL